MISIDNFNYVIWNNLLKPYDSLEHIFYPHGSLNLISSPYSKLERTEQKLITGPRVFFYDQEPLLENQSQQIFQYHKLSEDKKENRVKQAEELEIKDNFLNGNLKVNILANSEHSELKTQLCQEFNMADWYYFYHGFASLYWFNDYRFLTQTNNIDFTKVFITFNRLVSANRSYRLYFVSSLLDQGLDKHGHISLQLQDEIGTWEQEIFRRDSLLTPGAKKTIYKNLKLLEKPLIVDNDSVKGVASAQLDLNTNRLGFWNVVTETVYYQNKQHLTEKIFKPIVGRQPFILLGAYKNLDYLKSYGFKTFSSYIDESYDLEVDNVKRTDMVVAELKKLCQLSTAELKDMHNDMQDILAHNFHWFYHDFKHIIVNELVDNFKETVTNLNYNPGLVNWAEVKSLLKQ